jgi:hypothetical protein
LNPPGLNRIIIETPKRTGYRQSTPWEKRGDAMYANLAILGTFIFLYSITSAGFEKTAYFSMVTFNALGGLEASFLLKTGVYWRHSRLPMGLSTGGCKFKISTLSDDIDRRSVRDSKHLLRCAHTFLNGLFCFSK